MAKGVLHNEPLRYGAAMPLNLSPSRALHFFIISSLALTSASADGAQLADYQSRGAFAERWWKAHVVLDLKTTGDTTLLDSIDRPRSVKGFLWRQGGELKVVAPTAAVRGVRAFALATHTGVRCMVRIKGVPQGYDAPLITLPACDTLEADHPALAWAKAPELGPGRRVWLLERPSPLTPDSPPPPPVLIESALGMRAAQPLAPYWRVALRSAIGAPLLDDEGRILCVVFRPSYGDRGSSLCSPREVALVNLKP